MCYSFLEQKQNQLLLIDSREGLQLDPRSLAFYLGIFPELHELCEETPRESQGQLPDLSQSGIQAAGWS